MPSRLFTRGSLRRNRGCILIRYSLQNASNQHLKHKVSSDKLSFFITQDITSISNASQGVSQQMARDDVKPEQGQVASCRVFETIADTYISFQSSIRRSNSCLPSHQAQLGTLSSLT